MHRQARGQRTRRDQLPRRARASAHVRQRGRAHSSPSFSVFPLRAAWAGRLARGVSSRGNSIQKALALTGELLRDGTGVSVSGREAVLPLRTRRGAPSARAAAAAGRGEG